MRNEQERLARQWAESCQPYTLTSTALAARDYILATTAPPTMADVEWNDEKHHLAGATTPGGDDVVMMWHNELSKYPIICDNDAYRADCLTPNGKKYELCEVTGEPEHPVEPSTKTMDEYSPEEQADMIGMWAEYRAGSVGSDFVIIEEGVNRAGRVPCYNPEAPVPSAWAPDPDELTPRFDLPRVWDKGGQPCKRAVGGYQPKPEHPEVLRTVEDYENAPEGTVVDICGTAAIRQNYGWAVTGYRYKLGNDEMFQQGDGVVVRWGE